MAVHVYTLHRRIVHQNIQRQRQFPRAHPPYKDISPPNTQGNAVPAGKNPLISGLADHNPLCIIAMIMRIVITFFFYNNTSVL